jgi:hypothetical protein
MAEKLLIPLAETNPLLAVGALGIYGAVEVARELSRPRQRQPFIDTQGLHPISTDSGESLSRARDIAERIRNQNISPEEKERATEAVRQSARESETLVPQPGFVDVPLNTPRGQNVIPTAPGQMRQRTNRGVRQPGAPQPQGGVQLPNVRGRRPGRILPRNAGKAIVGGLGATTIAGIASTLGGGGGTVYNPPSTPGTNPITPTPPGGLSVPSRAPRAVGGPQFFQPSERGPQFFIPPFGTPLSYKNLVTNTRHDAYNLYYKNISIPTGKRL